MPDQGASNLAVTLGSILRYLGPRCGLVRHQKAPPGHWLRRGRFLSAFHGLKKDGQRWQPLGVHASLGLSHYPKRAGRTPATEGVSGPSPHQQSYLLHVQLLLASKALERLEVHAVDRDGPVSLGH